MRASARGPQCGFSLVELMVALAIGLILTAVVAHLFSGTRATYATTDELSRMHENMRYSHQLLTRTIHLAGYRSAPNSVIGQIFNAANRAIDGSDGAGNASDTLVVRFQGSSDGAGSPDGSIVNCAGQEIAAGVMAVNIFTVGVGANGGNALFCNGAEAVPDVENMQLRYGEDVNGDLVADRYVRITEVANLDRIVSVRLALLFRTPNVAARIAPTAATYDLNGTTVGPFNDTRIRRPITITVNLRNRTP